MNVLLIYPNLHAQIGFNYGVAFISAVLKDRGHSCRLINLNEQLGSGVDLGAIRREIEEFDPGLIGFSVVTNQYRYSVEIARSIKEYSSVPIVCGGVHATMAPEDVLREGCFDYACVGEGENALLELVEKVEKNEPPTSIANIWSIRDGEVIRNEVRPFVPLESLPQKDYEIFDFQRMIDAKDGWVGLMASRGCPFRCSYCFNHRIVDIYRSDLGRSAGKLGYLRWHSISDILAEIDFLLDTYQNIRMFIFDDDLFTLDKEFVLDFCAAYRDRGRVPFVCNAHVQAFDEEIAESLKASGCAIVKFGLESGSERVRTKVLNRHMSNQQIKEAFRIAHGFGLHTSAFVMIGLPCETRGDIFDTLNLLAEIQPGRFRWALFFPFVGTRAYELSREEGYIDFDKMKNLTNFTDDSCLDFGPEHNLFIRKLKRAFPWYVNALSGLPGSELYQALVNEVEMVPEDDWGEAEARIMNLDAKVSTSLAASGQRHYTYRYNSFTAVESGVGCEKDIGPLP